MSIETKIKEMVRESNEMLLKHWLDLVRAAYVDMGVFLHETKIEYRNLPDTILAFNEFLKAKAEELHQLQIKVENAHTALLNRDYLKDDSERGQP